MKSVLIIGVGRFGRHMARKFIEEGHEVLAIELDEERADSCIDMVPNIQIGDATDERFVNSLGVANFDICVIAIGDKFQTVLEITVLLKDLGAKYVVARASRDVHKKLLLRNGADYVVYGERELAEKLAIKLGSENIFDCIALDSEYAIYEIAVPKSWVGKTIIELAVRNRYNISILAIKENFELKPMPPQNHIFSKDETLIIMGDEKSVRNVTK